VVKSLANSRATLFSMSPAVALAELTLYCTQQLGIMLGVGAEIIGLVMYLIASRDNTIDKDEERFLRATKRVLYFGIAIIFISGLLITILSPRDTIMQPAYLFKWVLIVFVTSLAFVDMSSSAIHDTVKGIAAGSWFALFAVHILAPVTTWINLGLITFLWMIGFMTCWMALTFVLHGKKSKGLDTPVSVAVPAPVTQKPKVSVPPPRPIPAPIVPPLAPIRVQTPVPPPAPRREPIAQPLKPTFAVPKSAEAFPYQNPSPSASPMLHPHLTEMQSSGVLPMPPSPTQSGALAAAGATADLPAVHVMPKTPEDLESQQRAPIVRYG
jgi:hypothetical protein